MKSIRRTFWFLVGIVLAVVVGDIGQRFYWFMMDNVF